ncbi:unnamed protein product [Linum tenue]|uniref:Glycosyltransferase 7 n=1 Tax=Linum tenue TaxID=586396 RepID=A0AAV0JCY1_9ROSI|nr:unnamed protein product [Linum tenue]CAI0406391.1 unnamed protein product [Linum tenue]
MRSECCTHPTPNLRFDPPDSTFYDDSELRYSIDKKVTGWDDKRKEWLKRHPTFTAGSKDMIVMVTGSQPNPCQNPIGDHLLLRAFKNKVDYCRIHGYDVFYNNWSMDFIDAWANMGTISPDYKKWGEIQRSVFKDKLFPESNDQTALIYLIYKDRRLTDKIYLEGEYYFKGYWVEIVPTYYNITKKYVGIEREDNLLRRRHAEKVSEQYAAFREPHLKEAGNGRWCWRRPFITHFTGCQPCSGNHNQIYAEESCWNGMLKALNFADNQVLRKYGFVHPDLLDSKTVTDSLFDYPDEGPW